MYSSHFYPPTDKTFVFLVTYLDTVGEPVHVFRKVSVTQFDSCLKICR
jgi:hypothetical protein